MFALEFQISFLFFLILLHKQAKRTRVHKQILFDAFKMRMSLACTLLILAQKEKI